MAKMMTVLTCSGHDLGRWKVGCSMPDIIYLLGEVGREPVGSVTVGGADITVTAKPGQQ